MDLSLGGHPWLDSMTWTPLHASTQRIALVQLLNQLKSGIIQIPANTQSDTQAHPARSTNSAHSVAIVPSSSKASRNVSAYRADSCDESLVTSVPRFLSIHKSPIECGNVDPATGERRMSEYCSFFGRRLEIYTAQADPQQRVLYRASVLSEKFDCATNKIGMYLARRRHSEDGLYQATTFLYKPAGRTGLKSGGYFLSLSVCKKFEIHFLKQMDKKKIKAETHAILHQNKNNHHETNENNIREIPTRSNNNANHTNSEPENTVLHSPSAHNPPHRFTSIFSGDQDVENSLSPFGLLSGDESPFDDGQFGPSPKRIKLEPHSTLAITH